MIKSHDSGSVGDASTPSARHYEANWANQTIWTRDNLEIMRGMEYLISKIAT